MVMARAARKILKSSRSWKVSAVGRVLVEFGGQAEVRLGQAGGVGGRLGVGPGLAPPALDVDDVPGAVDAHGPVQGAGVAVAGVRHPPLDVPEFRRASRRNAFQASR